MLNPFAYPSFVLWAAQLIRHKHPESLGILKRVIRNRLMLGTQMQEVEGDIYERGLGLFLVIDIVFLPASLVFGYILIDGTLFSSAFTSIDFLYAFLGTIGCSSIVVGPIIFLGMPLLGRHAAKKHKIRPQPFETVTDRVATYQIFRSYLRHIAQHRKWNPLYLLFVYFAALGSHFYGKSGDQNFSDGTFNAYATVRAVFPLAYSVLLLSVIVFYLEHGFSFGVLFFLALGLFAIALLHAPLGRAHGDIPLYFDTSRPKEVSRAQYAKTAAWCALGTVIGVNFKTILSWINSFL